MKGVVARVAIGSEVHDVALKWLASEIELAVRLLKRVGIEHCHIIHNPSSAVHWNSLTLKSEDRSCELGLGCGGMHRKGHILDV